MSTWAQVCRLKYLHLVVFQATTTSNMPIIKAIIESEITNPLWTRLFVRVYILKLE